MFLLFLLSYDENGHSYDSESKKVLLNVAAKTENFILPQSVESIAGGTEKTSPFYQCQKVLKTFSCEKGSKLNSIPVDLFRGTYATTVDFSNCEELTYISVGCFNYAIKLKTIKLPPNIVEIRGGAFHHANEIETIFFPNSLRIIGDYIDTYGCALGYCSKLTTIEFGDNPSLEYIGSNAFYDSALTTFHIPKTLIHISNGVFCLNDIVFTCDEENPYFSTDGRSIYNKDGNILYIVSTKQYNDVYVVNESVKSIQSQAFRNVPGDTIIFTNQNVQLDILAFYDTYIKNITFPTELSVVPRSCFQTSRIEYVFLSENVTKIEQSAFADCKNLKELIMEEGLIEIQTSAFSNSPNVIQLKIPNSVTSILTGAFTGISIDRIKFENTTRFRFDSNFLYCDSYIVDYIGTNANAEIEIPNNCKGISEKMFQNKNVKKITFEDSSVLESIGESAFESSTLKEIILPPSLTKIGSYAFKNCKNLISVTLNGSFTIIPTECFSNCDKLKTFIINEDNEIETIGQKAFLNCIQLEINFMELDLLT